MSNKLVATVLFAMLTLSSSSCSDTPSTAGEFLAKSKASAASGDQEANAGEKDAGAEEGTDAGEEGGAEAPMDGAAEDAKPDGAAADPMTPAPKPGDPVVVAPKPGDPVVVAPKPGDPVVVPPKPGDPVVVTPKPVALTYAEINTKFFSKYCIACHGIAGGVDLKTYANVKKHIDKIKTTALVEKSMPKIGSLMPSEADLKLLKDWIDASAPEK